MYMIFFGVYSKILLIVNVKIVWCRHLRCGLLFLKASAYFIVLTNKFVSALGHKQTPWDS